MALNEFEVDMLFPHLWKIYPNKEKEFAARKALRLLFREHRDTDPEKLKQIVKIYALETEGDEFHYRFDNFLRNDHWRDIYDQYDHVDDYLESLESKRGNCVYLIEKWNKACKPHWCKCKDPESRIPMVKKALQNEFFAKNWDKALWVLTRVFKHRFREADYRSNIVVSLRWFCRVSSETHTVSRLIEGEYGKMHGDGVTPKPPPPSGKASPEIRAKAMETFYDVFPERKPKTSITEDELED